MEINPWVSTVWWRVWNFPVRKDFPLQKCWFVKSNKFCGKYFQSKKNYRILALQETKKTFRSKMKPKAKISKFTMTWKFWFSAGVAEIFNYANSLTSDCWVPSQQVLNSIYFMQPCRIPKTRKGSSSKICLHLMCKARHSMPLTNFSIPWWDGAILATLALDKARLERALSNLV